MKAFKIQKALFDPRHCISLELYVDMRITGIRPGDTMSMLDVPPEIHCSCGPDEVTKLSYDSSTEDSDSQSSEAIQVSLEASRRCTADVSR